MSTGPDSQGAPVTPDRLRALVAQTRLSSAELARELGVDEATLCDWCNGSRQAPRMALHALERLVAQGSADADVLADACRRAAIQARLDARKYFDPIPALTLITIAEVYERLARRQEQVNAPAGQAPPAKKVVPRPS